MVAITEFLLKLSPFLTADIIDVSESLYYGCIYLIINIISPRIFKQNVICWVLLVKLIYCKNEKKGQHKHIPTTKKMLFTLQPRCRGKTYLFLCCPNWHCMLTLSDLGLLMLRKLLACKEFRNLFVYPKKLSCVEWLWRLCYNWCEIADWRAIKRIPLISVSLIFIHKIRWKTSKCLNKPIM